MLIISICIALILSGLIAALFYWHETLIFILLLLGIAGLSMCIVSLPIVRCDNLANIAEYNATQETINNARANGIDIEGAAIQHKIIEMNQWIAGAQYYNTTMWDLWVPDEVDDLEFIK